MNPTILLDWDSPSYSISRFPSVLRRQSLGLGCSFGTPRPPSPRALGLCFPRPSYQQFGVMSSFPSTTTFSESHLRLLRDGSFRQFVSSGLPQELTGDPLSISVHASMGGPLLVSSLVFTFKSDISRKIEC